MGAESERVRGFASLDEGLRSGDPWYRWGPYLSERQWGTVREDYSPDGEAWSYLPHDRARSQAYRWGEDGLAGFSDVEQRLCLGLALWNGRDPILKERIFGLTGPEGNHGEDAKEYWWYLDAVPSHAWNRWRYHYPQGAFPYEDLVATNGARGRHDPEYELLDTGVFDDDRYWVVEVHYAKADPDDLLVTVEVTNAGPERAELHVLPTLWFRNTWSWEPDATPPAMRATGPATVAVPHPFLGGLELAAGPAPDGAGPDLLFCDNETNLRRLYGTPGPEYPKDGINDHVVRGAATVNPEGAGTKCAVRYRLAVDPGGTVELRLRLRPADRPGDLGEEFTRVRDRRRAEADEFYAELTPAAASADEANVMRQAFAGLLWSKQFYHYDVARWLDGDPGQPRPPASREHGRNARWRTFNSFDVMSMPDKWEYPWFASWDLAFHCVALAHVDPGFAKYQLILVCREWFQHPDGALPAYEWDFGDINPPVQAWAALEVFALDGARDVDFLSRVFDKLLVNFTWWVNLQDSDGSNVFEGGFLGLDNIGPIDRSHLPPGFVLEQSDATGWMAAYALAMGVMAAVLRAAGQRPADDLVRKFLEHLAAIRGAVEAEGLWDPETGLFADRLLAPDGTVVPVAVRSMVGVIPMLAAGVADETTLRRAAAAGKHVSRLLDRKGLDDEADLAARGLLRGGPGNRQLLLGVVGVDKLESLFTQLFDPAEFLSPHGLRSVSAYHREHPYVLDAPGLHAEIDYEPAESTVAMFGGNSNWRGPVWFPVNHLVVTSLERYHRFFGDDHTVEYPTGSGKRLRLDEVVADLWERLVSLFLVGDGGRRPCFGGVERLQRDPRWKDNLLFNEYFHGDDGAGLGASHQTGWTGLVADVIRRRHGAVDPVGDVLRTLRERGPDR
ncbi:MGH1-like glycoside hydrolase domain-containing protein [Pseudonocardia halophobica]|uniref:MGH1-like glycoside hydrolase domain-containing protein n=1 Tax=Pseudonocardia halophobica TaxID=29401 RepID=UPI000B002A09|nr:glucosidase [Pseudonocardia halophobica]